ncbi:sensor histidine kinase [Tsuneonella rigui]|uniref:sensor histidine kinase n=1 Tax=Tsuneonella rigui TaxID=1708790 RepID=UPI0013DF968F|nr:HAMP domain-containing sensor histidine kinase [Tsuneonella rigui]
MLARDYAIADLRDQEEGPPTLVAGQFFDMAARNPDLWLVVLKRGRIFTWGKVTPEISRTVIGLRTVTDSALFRVPAAAMPLAGSAIRQIEFPDGPALVAAGGVDPATLSTWESVQLLRDPTVAAMLVAVAVLSLIGMGVAARAFRRALEPIIVEATSIGADDPTRRLAEAKAPRELGPLVDAFNAALDRLERELGRRRRFITDVAHELRTPLAVVTLQADALPAVEGKADLQRGLVRVTRLLGQMLDLERLTLAVNLQEGVDLIPIVRDAAADLAPMAVDRGYRLSLDTPDDPVRVTADPHAIHRAAMNLISNAIAHGGGSGAIGIRVGTDATITVLDEGPGVDPDLAPRLFEPFVRGHSEEEGSGLGLHLVREIMRSHDGDVEHRPSTAGSMFRLVFSRTAGSPKARNRKG